MKLYTSGFIYYRQILWTESKTNNILTREILPLSSEICVNKWRRGAGRWFLEEVNLDFVINRPRLNTETEDNSTAELPMIYHRNKCF